MNRKILFGLGILLILLLGLVLLPTILVRLGVKDEANNITIKTLKKDSIDTIEIRQGSSSAILKRTDSNWMIADDPADSSRVTGLLDGYDTMSVRSTASTNPANASQFGVDESGYHLTISSQGKKDEFMIGSVANFGDSFFAKIRGKDTVYSIEGVLRQYMQTDNSYWMDKTILSIDKDTISKIVFSGSKNITLEKNKDGVWEQNLNEKKETTDKDKINSLLGVISHLTGEKVAAPENGKEFESSPKDSVDIYDLSNKVLGSIEMLKINKDWLIRNKQSSKVWIVNERHLNPLITFLDEK